MGDAAGPARLGGVRGGEQVLDVEGTWLGALIPYSSAIFIRFRISSWLGGQFDYRPKIERFRLMIPRTASPRTAPPHATAHITASHTTLSPITGPHVAVEHMDHIDAVSGA